MVLVDPTWSNSLWRPLRHRSPKLKRARVGASEIYYFCAVALSWELLLSKKSLGSTGIFSSSDLFVKIPHQKQQGLTLQEFVQNPDPSQVCDLVFYPSGTWGGPGPVQVEGRLVPQRPPCAGHAGHAGHADDAGDADDHVAGAQCCSHQRRAGLGLCSLGTSWDFFLWKTCSFFGTTKYKEMVCEIYEARWYGWQYQMIRVINQNMMIGGNSCLFWAI